MATLATALFDAVLVSAAPLDAALVKTAPLDTVLPYAKRCPEKKSNDCTWVLPQAGAEKLSGFMAVGDVLADAEARFCVLWKGEPELPVWVVSGGVGESAGGLGSGA